MTTSELRVLTVNAGSSSLRLAGFNVCTKLVRVADEHFASRHQLETEIVTDFIERHHIGPVDAVVHRVVYGGSKLTAPCIVDFAVEAEIERLAPLAPLHNPVALAAIRACRRAIGSQIVQIAVFDTGFFADMPLLSTVYALPQDLCERHGIRRYGFHGLAHQAMLDYWCAHGVPGETPGRVISLQLGAGCSITASDGGLPVDTSMGFSPLEGLMMATRCGDFDLAVLLFLQREAGFNVAELEQLLNEQAGLRGVSAETGDMRALLRSDGRGAELAVALYCRRAGKYVGAYLSVLGGADAILFGGGVGEHAPEIRSRILADMEWAGVRMDAQRNARHVVDGGRVSADDSDVEVWVTPVDEAQVLVQEGLTALQSPWEPDNVADRRRR